MDPLLLLSATELAARIRRGELQSRDVVEAHIQRIERANPSLNAMVATRFDEARREADAADDRVRKSPDSLPPFHGVPCSIKEAFALTGMPNTAGLVARKGRLATEDATAVARLRQAGAIPLGVTNTSELCMWMESANCVYGRSNNPYDPTRTVGGSSGGEGAIVGVGGAPFGLGSDIGGSIRMPAFFNGVFGHKPTGGLVPGSGQFPFPEGHAVRYLATGPITRRAIDLMPILRILAGPDGKDPGTIETTLGDPAKVAIEGMSVLDVEGDGRTRVEPALRAAQERAAKALANAGARINKVQIKGLTRALELWSAGMSTAAQTTYSALLGEGTPIRPIKELIKFTLNRSPHTLPSLILALIDRAPLLFPSRTRAALEAARALRRELCDRIGDGVLLYPPYPRIAPRHHAPLWPPFQWVYTAIFNVLELPVTQVPLGLDPRRLPVGVQVVTTPFNDHRSIAIALALETHFGGWTPPPAFNQPIPS